MEQHSHLRISKKHLEHNVRVFRSLLGEAVALSAVIKANAYGHGQNIVAQAIEPHADFFQVNSLDEAVSLRKVTVKPVLILGYIPPERAAEAVQGGFHTALFAVEDVSRVADVARSLGIKHPVHIKIDAHVGRLGVLADQVEAMAINLAKHQDTLDVAGIYSHFTNIEDTIDQKHSDKQRDGYMHALEICKSHGIIPRFRHMSATSGILRYGGSEDAYTLARLGIGLYGLWPSPELRLMHEREGVDLRPVLTWVSRIAQVKTIPAGYPVGYGLSYIASRPTRIAVIPQGYSDGYDRGLSNRGAVLIRGQRCPVVGRVMMNMFVVDVSNIPEAQAEDEVILLGKQGDEEITADEIAGILDTINYEVTTRISPLLPRILVE